MFTVSILCMMLTVTIIITVGISADVDIITVFQVVAVRILAKDPPDS